MTHLGILTKFRLWSNDSHLGWGPDSAFLTSSHVMLMLMFWGPYFDSPAGVFYSFLPSKPHVLKFLLGVHFWGKHFFSFISHSLFSVFSETWPLPCTVTQGKQTSHFLMSRMSGFDCLVSFPPQHSRDVLIVLVIITLSTLFLISSLAPMHDLLKSSWLQSPLIFKRCL